MERQGFNSSAKLLQQITRDPKYVEKLSGAAVDSPSRGGRSWDDRFANSRMPQYDALNDRFCKFSLRRRIPSRNLKPQQRGQALSPLAQMDKTWGNAPRLQPVMPLGWPTKPGTAPTPDANGRLAAASAPPEGQLSIDAQFQRSRARLLKLWDERGTPESERIAFAQKYFLGGVTSETLAVINEEMQRLLDERNGAVQVERAIEVREGFLYLLQELTERFASTNIEKDRALRELNALVTPFRNASLDVVEAVQRWRETTGSRAQSYLWKGVSYLYKMSTDLFFLAHSRLRLLLDCDVHNNPFLDPRRAEEVVGGRLPPIKKNKDAKDIPRERIDKCERTIEEECQRLRQFAAPTRDIDGDAAPRIVRDDQEEAHVRVEEKAWLLANNGHRRDDEQTAAVRIQSAYRRYIATKYVHALLRQRWAVVKIQSIVRRFLAKLFTNKLKARFRAAQKLQSVQRGRSTRSKVAFARLRESSATKIQSIFRGHLARRLYGMMRYLRHCAVQIQRQYRGHLTRRVLKVHHTSVRGNAATRIQALWRGFVVRKQSANDPKKIAAAIRIQAWVRGVFTRARARVMLGERSAATKLQSWWRGTQARSKAQEMRQAKLSREWEIFVVLISAASLKIQSTWRMFRAKKAVQQIRAIQAERSYQEQLRVLEVSKSVAEHMEVEKHRAATKIQAIVRGRQGRTVARLFQQLNLFATTIQRVFRGHLGRVEGNNRRNHALMLTRVESLPVIATVTEANTHEVGDAQSVSPQELPSVDVSAVLVEGDDAPRLPMSQAHDEVERKRDAAATTVTRFFRRAVAVTCLRRRPIKTAGAVSSSQQEKNCSARMIQKWWNVHRRHNFATRKTHHQQDVARRQERWTAAVILQQRLFPLAAARNQLADRRIARAIQATRTDVQLVRSYAATMIQRVVRLHLSRRKRQMLVKSRVRHQIGEAQSCERNEAASTITRTLRRNAMNRRKEHRRKSLLHDAKALRSESTFAAKMIQRLFRRYAARCRVQATHINRRTALLSIAEKQETSVALSTVRSVSLAAIDRARLTRVLRVRLTAQMESVVEPQQAVPPTFPVVELQSQSSKRPAQIDESPTVVSPPGDAAQRHEAISTVIPNVEGATEPVAKHVQDVAAPETRNALEVAVPSVTNVQQVATPSATGDSASPQTPTVATKDETAAKKSIDASIPSPVAQGATSTVALQEEAQVKRASSPVAPSSTALAQEGTSPTQATHLADSKASDTVNQPMADESHDKEVLRSDEKTDKRPTMQQSLETTVQGHAAPADSPPVAVSQVPCSLTEVSSPSRDRADPPNEGDQAPINDSYSQTEKTRPPQTERVEERVSTVSHAASSNSNALSALGPSDNVQGTPATVARDSPRNISAQPTAAAIMPTVPAGRTATDATHQIRRERAALKIQCLARVFISRKRLLALRAQRHAKHQRAVEAALVVVPVTSLVADDQRLRIRQRAALRIQCAYRCYNARFMRAWKTAQRAETRRRALEAERSKDRQSAAVRLQCAWRVFSAKKCVSKRRVVNSALVKQKNETFQRHQSAALIIQRVGRAYNLRFEANWKRSVLQQQTIAERQAHEERLSNQQRLTQNERDASELSRRQQASAVTIQCAWRSHNARFERKQREQQQRERRMVESVVALQRFCRGGSARAQMRATKLLHS